MAAKPDRYTITTRFTPQPDITAYELARILKSAPNLQNPVLFTTEQWDAIDAAIKRHFAVSPERT